MKSRSIQVECDFCYNFFVQNWATNETNNDQLNSAKLKNFENF